MAGKNTTCETIAETSKLEWPRSNKPVEDSQSTHRLDRADLTPRERALKLT